MHTLHLLFEQGERAVTCYILSRNRKVPGRVTNGGQFGKDSDLNHELISIRNYSIIMAELTETRL